MEFMSKYTMIAQGKLIYIYVHRWWIFSVDFFWLVCVFIHINLLLSCLIIIKMRWLEKNGWCEEKKCRNECIYYIRRGPIVPRISGFNKSCRNIYRNSLVVSDLPLSEMIPYVLVYLLLDWLNSTAEPPRCGTMPTKDDGLPTWRRLSSYSPMNITHLSHPKTSSPCSKTYLG